MSMGDGGATATARLAGRRPQQSLFRQAYGAATRHFTHGLFVVLGLAVIDVFIEGGGRLAGETIRNALVLGAIYATVAVGYTMVYGIIELINFAHGDVFTLAAFYALQSDRIFGLTPLATSSGFGLAIALVAVLLITMIAAGLTGMLIEFVAYRPLRHKPRLAPLITAIGMSFMIEGIIQVLWGVPNVPTHKETWVSGIAVTVGGVDISWHAVVVVLTALVLMLGLQAFVQRTRLGRAMRATAQDRDAAQLSGISVNRTISLTFFIGSALAGAGAIIYSINYGSIQWQMGFHLGIIAFTAAVLGGIGNITGAGLGAFLIGAIYVFGGQIAGPEWSESLIFAVLVIILTFRPTGILGAPVSERA